MDSEYQYMPQEMRVMLSRINQPSYDIDLVYGFLSRHV